MGRKGCEISKCEFTPECYSAVIQIFSGTWIRSKRKKTFPGENEICTFGIFMNESHSKKHTFTTLDVFLSCLNCLQPFYSLGVNDRKWNQFHDPALLNQIPPHRISKKNHEGFRMATVGINPTNVGILNPTKIPLNEILEGVEQNSPQTIKAPKLLG